MATPLEDYALDFSGGQDASQIPARVNINQFYSGINVSCSQGILRPRFAFIEKILKFNIPKDYILSTGFTRTYESIYYGGLFQAAIPYIIGVNFFHVHIVSGIIFLINQNTWEVTLIEIADGSKIDEFNPRINWSYAGKYVEIFDFPAFPVILDGYTARRADPARMETPPALIGTYNQNRVFFANAGNEFTASDPAAYGFPDGPLSCTEIETLAGSFFGQIFQLSTNYINDPITAMGFLQATDSSTGIGPLLVSTKNTVFSYQSQLARSQWSNGTIQFGSAFITDTGIVGQRAFANVGSDIYFVDPTGQIRSASMSRQEQGSFSKIPLSKEVNNFIGSTINPDLLKYSTVTYFENKILISVNPYFTEVSSTDLFPRLDTAFGGYVVLELDNISNLENQANPDWAGLWTGIRPMETYKNDLRCFSVAKQNGRNSIFEITPDLTYDVIGVDQKIRKIRSKVYTREYSFNQPFINKTLNSIDINFFDLKGDFKLNLKYRPSHGSKFIKWTEFLHSAPWRTCTVPKDKQWLGLEGHQFREANLGSPEDRGEDPVTREYMDTCKRVQLLLELEGIYWEIHEFRIRAVVLPENTTEPIRNDYPLIEIYGTCNTDWEIPDICLETQVT